MTHRVPRTTQERRYNGRKHFQEIDGYLIKIRPKRNKINLVDAWDDIIIRDYYRRNWKHYRKHQWKN